MALCCQRVAGCSGARGLLNKTLSALTCGLFYSVPGKCKTGEETLAAGLFRSRRHHELARCWRPCSKPWGSLGGTVGGGGGNSSRGASKSQPINTGVSPSVPQGSLAKLLCHAAPPAMAARPCGAKSPSYGPCLPPATHPWPVLPWGGGGCGCSKTSPASRDAGGGSMFPKHQLPKPQASSPLALTDLLPVGEGI